MVLGRSSNCLRKEQRYAASRAAMTAAVYFDNKRYDAEVIDESDSGMSLRVPSEATIQAGRRVRVISKKITFGAVIKWVKANPDSFEFGIRLAK